MQTANAASREDSKLTDDEREQLIEIHCQLSTQGSPQVRTFWWNQLRDLIKGRSAEQVERMERAKGLRSDGR